MKSVNQALLNQKIKLDWMKKFCESVVESKNKIGLNWIK